jgi:hypothetical protein
VLGEEARAPNSPADRVLGEAANLLGAPRAAVNGVVDQLRSLPATGLGADVLAALLLALLMLCAGGLLTAPRIARRRPRGWSMP